MPEYQPTQSAPRLSVEIERHQFDALQRLIPYGLKKQIFGAIVDDLISMLENSPKREAVFAAIISKMVNVPERTLQGAEDGS